MVQNKRKKRIVFLSSYFRPTGGGIANVVEDLAVELARQKQFSIEIIARGVKGAKKKEVYKGVKVRRVKVIDTMLIRDVMFMFNLIIILSKKKYNRAIIHCNEAHTMGFVGFILKKLNKHKKVIIQTHGWDLNRFLEKYTLTRWLLKIILSSADLLLPISTFQKRQIFKFIKPKKLVVFSNCRNIEQIKLTKEECKKKWNLPNNKTNIVFVGRNLKRKGPHIFVDVVNSLKGVKGHIVGFSGESTSKIKYYDEISQHDVFEVMKGCDIFLFPTKKEAFGLVFLEAAASELAIITSNELTAGGGTDIFTHGKNALLVRRNRPAMKKAVEELLKNKTKREKLARKGKEVCKKYTPEKIAKKYTSIVNKYF